MNFKWWQKSKVQQKADLNEFNPIGVPSNVMKLTGNKEIGPNCWNATIMFFDEQEPVRYTPPEVMVEWLTKNTAEDNYKFQAVGSILVLFNEEQEEANGLIHTAVYVAPSILFHKRGTGGHWEFITEKQLRQIYFETTRSEYRLFSETKI